VKNKNSLSTASGEEVIIAKTYPTDLSTTLQYAQGFGDIALREFAREHVKVGFFLAWLMIDGSFTSI
jgi:hypothetical protein